MRATGRAIPPPMSRHWSGRRRLDWLWKGWLRPDQAPPEAHGVVNPSGLGWIGDHQLDQDSVIVGYFCIQHTGLSPNNTLQLLHGNTVSFSDGGSLHADEFVMFHVGCVTQ